MVKKLNRVGIILMAMIVFVCMSNTALAEGSKELTEHGGYRPYTERNALSTEGENRLSEFSIFMNKGEVVYLGTSVKEATLYDDDGAGNVTKWHYDNDEMGMTGGNEFTNDELKYINSAEMTIITPSWNKNTNPGRAPYAKGERDESVQLFDVTATEDGYISSRAMEKAGPDIAGSGTGYKVNGTNTLPTEGKVQVGTKTNANKYVAPETGVYTFIAFSKDLGSSNPGVSLIKDDEAWNQNQGYIAAWDASVYSDAGVEQTGRVFTNTLFLNMGSNINATDVLNSKVYVLTDDGYEYLIDFNGMDPFGFMFYANSRGLLKQDTEDTNVTSSLSHSVKSDNNKLDDLIKHHILQNTTPTNSDVDKSYRIFVQEPSDATKEALGIAKDPTSGKGQISDFKFIGKDEENNTEDNMGVVGKGGTFSFKAGSILSATSYEIRLKFGDDNVVVLSNALVKNGTNTIKWNGLDAKGHVVPAGEYGTGTLSVELKGGEIHFPLIDVENNTNGIKVSRLNGGGTEKDKNTLFYNNSNTNIGDITTPWTESKNWVVADKKDATLGVDSTDGALAYSDRAGDQTALDVWANYNRTATPENYEFTLYDSKVDVPIKGKKVLTGDKTTFEDNEFKFNITEDTKNDTTGYSNFENKVTLSSDGTINFGNISFTKEGEYKFTANEVDSGTLGYTYDKNKVDIKIVVEDDGEGHLKATTTYEKADGTKSLEFNNKYTKPADPVDVPVIGQKLLIGDKTTFEDNEFKFNITEDKDNDATGYSDFENKATLSSDGTINFGNITFVKPGEYKFIASEVNSGVENYTYDEYKVHINVVVTDGGKGKLEATTSYDKEVGADALLFVNKYTEPGDDVIDDDGDGDNNNDNNQDNNNQNNKNKNNNGKNINTSTSKTGDDYNLYGIILLLAVAGSTMAVALRKKNR